MQSRFAILALVLLLVGCGPSLRKQSEVACSTQQADGILLLEWKVGVVTHGGTGFILRNGNKDYVVTAAHTVSEPKGKLHLMYADGTPIPFIVQNVYRKEGIDAVVFEVTSLPDAVRRFQASVVSPGATVEAYGYPGSLEARKCVRASGTAVTRVLEASCRIQEGMSGGPLLSGGKVVGVASSRVLRSDGQEHSNYADIADVIGMIK